MIDENTSKRENAQPLSGGEFIKNQKPETVTLPPFTVVGIKIEGLTQETSHARLVTIWTEFNRRVNEIRNMREGTSYAVYEGVTPEEASAGKPWWGLVCVEVSNTTVIPEGMITQTIPEGQYIVYTHRGPIAGLGQSFNWIFQNGIPPGFQYDKGHPDFEKYDWKRYFSPDDPRTEVDICIPITKTT